VKLALALCVAASAVAAAVAHATTQPGIVYVEQLRITDHAIFVRSRHHTWSSSVRYLRGAEVRYEVTNRGTRSYSLNVLGSVTGRLAPGRRTTILVYWPRRGTFTFRARPPGPRLRVSIA
jgi:hypothetical protein